MARTPLRLVRATNPQTSAYTGSSGEPVFNSDTKRLHLQDGVTPGGIPQASLVDLNSGLAGKPLQAASYASVLYKLAIGSSVNIGVFSDSTADETTEWPYLLSQALATRYPSATVNYYIINVGAMVYSGPTIIQAGGSQTINIYVCAVSGYRLLGHCAPNIQVTAGLDLDLAYFSSGHNESPLASDPKISAFWGDYVGAVEQILSFNPRAGTVLIIENPENGNEGAQAVRGTLIRDYAALRGFDVVDIRSLWFTNPNWRTDWMKDVTHPNSAGEVVWANAVAAQFPLPSLATAILPSGERSQSSFLRSSKNLLRNPTFATYSGADPDQWYSVGATSSKDATKSAGLNGYSVKITSNAAGVAALGQDVFSAAQIGPFLGKYITFSALIYIPTGIPDQVSAGVLSFDFGSVFPTSIGKAGDQSRGGWRWETVTGYVPKDASRIRVFVYADKAAAAAGQILNVDRASLCLGRLPCDSLFSS